MSKAKAKVEHIPIRLVNLLMKYVPCTQAVQITVVKSDRFELFAKGKCSDIADLLWSNRGTPKSRLDPVADYCPCLISTSETGELEIDVVEVKDDP